MVVEVQYQRVFLELTKASTGCPSAVAARRGVGID